VSKNTGSVPATRATIKDVASAAKTGKTSISRYLNGEQHLLSDALKARIERAISLLNYQPSQMARSLKSGQTRLIGLIIADITTEAKSHYPSLLLEVYQQNLRAVAFYRKEDFSVIKETKHPGTKLPTWVMRWQNEG